MGKELHIIFPKGVIPELDYKIDMFISFLQKEGIDYIEVNAYNPNAMAEKINAMISQGNCVMFTYNNVGTNWTHNGENIWKKNNIPVFDYIVDHPRYYDDTLLEPLCDIYVICCDKNHAEFIRRFYKKVKAAYFIPQGGTEVNSKVPPSKRSGDVIYMGDCKPTYESVSSPPIIKGFVEDFYAYCVGKLYADPAMTTEEVIESFFTEKEIPVSEDQLFLLYKNTSHDIESIVRHSFQLMGMHALDNAGVHVDIYGAGWEDPDNPFSDNIVIHPRTTMEQLLGIVGDSKISLCFIPWFKRGCSEKNYDSLLNGTLCVTDESEVLKERYKDGENIIFFDLRNPEQMAADVKWLLEHPQQLGAIAGRGYATAKKYDTWDCRYEEIYKLMSSGSN